MLLCRYGFQKELFLLLEKLVRDMDKKIERQKERAEKESEPRVLTADDQRRLDEILVRPSSTSSSPMSMRTLPGCAVQVYKTMWVVVPIWCKWVSFSTNAPCRQAVVDDGKGEVGEGLKMSASDKRPGHHAADQSDLPHLIATIGIRTYILRFI